MSKVLIVGGGAAGMFASIFAAMSGHEVHVFEKNEKLGKKLYITGKGDVILQMPVISKNCFQL
jgi:predicted flavoprotein YhiN